MKNVWAGVLAALTCIAAQALGTRWDGSDPRKGLIWRN